MRQPGPFWCGRVQLRSPDGWTWWQKAEAPGPGWYWWDETGQCLEPAHEYELQMPTVLVQKTEAGHGLTTPPNPKKVTLRLAEFVLEGDWVRAWWDGKIAWTVAPASGPTPPRNHDQPRGGLALLRQAVERGGGQFQEAHADPQGWRVHWSRGGASYVTLVDPKLNVRRAGFCLSRGDAAHDLTSLVSLVEGRESQHADPRVWRGHTGW